MVVNCVVLDVLALDVGKLNFWGRTPLGLKVTDREAQLFDLRFYSGENQRARRSSVNISGCSLHWFCFCFTFELFDVSLLCFRGQYDLLDLWHHWIRSLPEKDRSQGAQSEANGFTMKHMYAEEASCWMSIWFLMNVTSTSSTNLQWLAILQYCVYTVCFFWTLCCVGVIWCFNSVCYGTLGCHKIIFHKSIISCADLCVWKRRNYRSTSESLQR